MIRVEKSNHRPDDPLGTWTDRHTTEPCRDCGVVKPKTKRAPLADRLAEWLTKADGANGIVITVRGQRLSEHNAFELAVLLDVALSNVRSR